MDWKPETELQVRTIFNSWAGSIPDNPFPDFAGKVSFMSIAEKPSFVIQLRTLYEARLKPTEVIKAYKPEMEASLGGPRLMAPNDVDIWNFQSPLKYEFGSQSADLEVPGSFRAVECPTCDGRGNTTCVVCSGTQLTKCPDCKQGKRPCDACSSRGKTACIPCRGKGYIANAGDVPGPDVLCSNCGGSGGNPCENCKGAGGLPCSTCKGQGGLPCAKCRAQGTQPCQQCSAAGKVVRGLSFQIQYNDANEQCVAHDPEMPDGLLPKGFSWNKVSEHIVDAEDVIVAAPDTSAQPPHLRPSVEAILKKAENDVAMQGAPARIIKQKLLVDRVPVFSVVYRFQDKIYDAWVTAVDGKAAAKESPFKDYAKDQTLKAMRLASEGKQAQAQEILSKASALVEGNPDLEQARDASFKFSTRDFLSVHGLWSLISGALLMAALAALSGPTRHLFWPVFGFGVVVVIAALFAGYLAAQWHSGELVASPSRRTGVSIVVSAGCALLGWCVFSAARIPSRLDRWEYESSLEDHFSGPIEPANLNMTDVDFLKFMIRAFEPLGVDVSNAKNAIDEAARLQEESRQRAEAQAQAEAKAKGARTARAEMVRQEIASQRRAASRARRKTKKFRKKKIN